MGLNVECRTRNRRIMKRSLRHSIFLVQHSALYNGIFETRHLHCPLCQVSTVQPLKGGQGGIFTGSPKVSRFGGIPERCPSWPKERDWKSRVPLKKWYRGFESLSLRQILRSKIWRDLAVLLYKTADPPYRLPSGILESWSIGVLTTWLQPFLSRYSNAPVLHDSMTPCERFFSCPTRS